MANFYPLPREIRESPVLVGNGGQVYGPFAFRIFDTADIVVEVQRRKEGGWQKKEVEVNKVSPAPFEYFTIKFPEQINDAVSFRVLGQRLHERSTDLTRGGTILVDEVEKETSKQGVILQELRRDLNKNRQNLYDITNALNEALKARDFACQWASAGYGIAVDDGTNPIGYSAYHWSVRAQQLGQEQVDAAKRWTETAKKEADKSIQAAFNSEDFARQSFAAANRAQEIDSNMQSKLDEAAKGAFGFDPQKIYDEGYVTDEFYYFTRDEGKIEDLAG